MTSKQKSRKMENEAVNTLAHYFRNESNTVHFLGADEGVMLFCDLLQNGKTIADDAPDMVLIKDEIAVIVEHFEFDSFQVTRKGSSSRTEQARIEREQSQISANPEGVVYHSKIKANSSYHDYVANVTRGFTDHYKRIAVYKKNLVDKGFLSAAMTTKTLFLIDDVSPIGSIAFDRCGKEQQTVPVVLAQCPEFLQLLECSPNLDYVLCCSSAGSDEFIWFIDLSELPAYVEKQCDYARMQFLGNYPSVVIGKISIPEGDIKTEV